MTKFWKRTLKDYDRIARLRGVKAKCALVKAQRAYRIRHAPTSDLLDSYPTEYDETITTINSLNL